MKSRLKRVAAILLATTLMMTNVLGASAIENVSGSTSVPEQITTEEAPAETPEVTQPKAETKLPEEAEKVPVETAPVEQPIPAQPTPIEPTPVAPEESIPVTPTQNAQDKFLYEFTDMTVEVTLEIPNSLPTDVTLDVQPVYNQVNETKPNADIQSYYESFKALFEKQYAEENITMLEYLSYNLRFLKDGNVCEPTGKVYVTYKYKDGLVLGNMLSDGTNVGIYYLDDQSNPAELQLGTIAEDKKSIVLNKDGTRIQELSFETTNFEQFTTGTNDNAVISYEYEDEKVSATITANRLDSAIFGADIQVTPVEKGEKYKEAEKMLTTEAESNGATLNGFLAYDISFVKDGKEVEPSKEVNVSLNFKEAVKPTGVDVEEVSLGHIKESNGNKELEILYDAAIKTNAESQVQSTEFKVDSFSTFTLSWNNGNGIEIEYIDEKGSPIGTSNNKSIKTETELSKIAPAINDYQYAYSSVAEEAKEAIEKEKIATYVKRGNTQWEYLNSNLRYSEIPGDEKIYMVYKKNTTISEEGKLTEIKTIDSASKGVKIEMFNYNGATPAEGWGGYGNGTIKKGLLNRKLNSAGIPTRADNNDALIDSFSTKNNDSYKGEANHLFSKSIYDKTGSYSYSSFDNYAYFNQTSGDFTVYNQIGTPSDENAFFYKRGNFMPFNEIKDGIFSTNKNLHDENGKPLSKTDARYGEELYKPVGKNDFHFGMTISANFAQPKDGKQGEKPLVYNFNGDDDLWVYVDDVLVLDIGGIHDAHSGYINFATGEVGVWDAKTTDKNPTLTTTTIKEQFKLAGALGSKELWKGNTFADYSSHKIKIFYMERGSGASNCKMNFNLPVVPEGSVNVKKEITNISEGAYSDILFDFKLYLEDAQGTTDYKNGKYQVKANQSYTLIDTDGHTELGKKTTDKNGVFQLKHGQTASFEGLAKIGTKYFIEETGVTQDQYDKFSINGADITENAKEVEGVAGTEFVIRSNPLTIGENAIVAFGNTCEGNNLKNLTIRKELLEGQSSKDVYKAQVLIGGEPYTGKYFINSGDNVTDVSRKADENGMITLSANESVTIKAIPSGTSFKVIEIELDDSKYYKEIYEVTDADKIKTEGEASGVLLLKQNAIVTIKNKQKLSSLVIEKTIDELYDINGDAIFTFEIIGPDKKVIYKTVRFTKDQTSKTQTITITGLPFGTYTVRELDSMRYVNQGEAVRTVELTNTTPGIVKYVNHRKYDSNYSHTDVVVNKFTVTEDGKISCTQDNLVSESANPKKKDN